MELASKVRYVVDLNRLNNELRELSYNQFLAEQCERRQIAKEIDDGIGQKLAYCEIKLGMLAKSLPDKSLESLNEIRSLVKQMIKENGRLTAKLSSSVLHDIGLGAAIKEALKEIQRENHIECLFEDYGQSKPLNDDINVFLLQAVRGLLVNAARYSQANHISVYILRQESQLEITVEDDGCGFDILNPPAGTSEKGSHLFGIREQIAYLGGELRVDSTYGLGTRVTLFMPT